MKKQIRVFVSYLLIFGLTASAIVPLQAVDSQIVTQEKRSFLRTISEFRSLYQKCKKPGLCSPEEEKKLQSQLRSAVAIGASLALLVAGATAGIIQYRKSQRKAEELRALEERHRHEQEELRIRQEQELERARKEQSEKEQQELRARQEEELRQLLEEQRKQEEERRRQEQLEQEEIQRKQAEEAERIRQQQEALKKGKPKDIHEVLREKKIHALVMKLVGELSKNRRITPQISDAVYKEKDYNAAMPLILEQFDAMGISDKEKARLGISQQQLGELGFL
jgi:flagellar biosynthesis GTPase FlhF